jgi:hypothetical protein
MGWQYRKRTDGKINVALDNNVWNFLFDRKLNLASELPSNEFAIFIPREIEIETEAIPVKESKAPLKEYIARTIAECGIKTEWVFGFATEGSGPQRRGGFGQGTWQGKTESEFYAAIRQRFLVGQTEMGSQLARNEGDAAVAAKSFSSVVLTCESRKVSGPLRFASEHGGAILYLDTFDGGGQTLKEFVTGYYQSL